MTTRELAIARIRELPDSFAQEVLDFIDFLAARRDSARWQAWKQLAEGDALVESDLSDYLSNLQEYEERLASGEIRW